MIGTVRDVARGGHGVVPGNNGPVFIPYVLCGETINYRISCRHRSVQWGVAEEILEKSPHRIEPPCPHYGTCGGCNLQHADYPHQIEIKRSILKGNLQRIASITLPEACDITTSPPFRYRTRMILQIRHGRMGLFLRGSHDLEPITQCPLMSEAMEDTFRQLSANRDILAVESGRLILLSNGIQVSALLETGGNHRHLHGPGEILFSLPQFQFSVAPGNFVQANRFTLSQFHRWVNFSESEWEKGVDLYAGAGFLTLPLSRQCRSITALEISALNVKSLKRNLLLNGITSVSVQRKRIGASTWPVSDLVVADPPRTGLPAQVRRELVNHPPRRLVYFSCDSATFSRDLAHLIGEGFHLVRIGIIDNTPQSDHMEMVASLRGAMPEQEESLSAAPEIRP